MPHMPEFAMGLRMRCHSPVGDSFGQVCGDFASWLRPNPLTEVPSYFCNAHSEPGDRYLPNSYIFRRVRIEAVLYIAAANRLSGAAELEALGRLETALGTVGGVPDWLGCRSTLGRYTARPAIGQGISFTPIP